MYYILFNVLLFLLKLCVLSVLSGDALKHCKKGSYLIRADLRSYYIRNLF